MSTSLHRHLVPNEHHSVCSRSIEATAAALSKRFQEQISNRTNTSNPLTPVHNLSSLASLSSPLLSHQLLWCLPNLRNIDTAENCCILNSTISTKTAGLQPSIVKGESAVPVHVGRGRGQLCQPSRLPSMKRVIEGVEMHQCRLRPCKSANTNERQYDTNTVLSGY